MDNKNKLISKEIVVFEHPPSRNELKDKTHDELFKHLLDIGVPRAQLETISDKDKRKSYMINETLRLEKPFPKIFKPVLIDVKLDIDNNEKIMRYKYVKHLYTGEKENKSYKNSVVSIEEYNLPLQVKDIMNNDKKYLINNIQNEILNLNLDEWNKKSQIMKFACDNGKSNTEKKLRAVELQKVLVKNNYKRHRITNFDISVY
tara:strand:+ start:92 stop:700 length:609 start_codon:yes stop_codon:yes gene_type:complete